MILKFLNTFCQETSFSCKQALIFDYTRTSLENLTARGPNYLCLRIKINCSAMAWRHLRGYKPQSLRLRLPILPYYMLKLKYVSIKKETVYVCTYILHLHISNFTHQCLPYLPSISADFYE